MQMDKNPCHNDLEQGLCHPDLMAVHGALGWPSRGACRNFTVCAMLASATGVTS